MGIAEKYLTKMNPRGCDVTQTIFGAKAGITEYDIAASLAYGQLSKAAYYLGRAKYCEDKEAAGRLSCHVESVIRTEMEKKQWKLTRERVEGLAQLVVYEGVFGVTCKACSGKGHQTTGMCRTIKKEACKKCHGTGAGQLSQRHRSRISKIPVTSWISTWCSRIEQFYRYVINLDSEVSAHIYKQFKNDC